MLQARDTISGRHPVPELNRRPRNDTQGTYAQCQPQNEAMFRAA